MYIYRHTRVSSCPGLISELLSLAKMLVVNEQKKIFCSHHCSPEWSMNKFRASNGGDGLALGH